MNQIARNINTASQFAAVIFDTSRSDFVGLLLLRVNQCSSKLKIALGFQI